MKRLGDRFVLEDPIGTGGMSIVYLGRDEVLDRSVAVKVLKGGFENSDVGERFQREGRTAARLSHPNVVQVYDAGEDELDGREVSYIVMEYVSGGDLKDLMDEAGPLSGRDVARIGADVAVGLAHAHNRGIVHRDIKPQNILMDEYGVPKLTDFGIAKALDSTPATQTGSYLGTAMYSAPEQLKGEEATPKTDVYSLGATLYHAALGEPPFEGTQIEVANQQISTPPVSPRERGAEIDRALDALIVSCLSKDPAARPKISEVSSTLLNVAAAATAPPDASSGASTGSEARAAGAAAIDGIVRAARSASAAGAVGVNAASRKLAEGLAREGTAPPRSGGPARTVTMPTRTFRSGPNRIAIAGLICAVLLMLLLVAWGVSALVGSGNAGSADGGGSDSGEARQQAAGGGANDGSGGGSAGDGEKAQKASDEKAQKPEKREPEKDAAPAPPPEQAADVVFDTYLSVVEGRDYETSWNHLSSAFQKRVGSLEDWERQQSSLTSFRVTGGGLQTDRVEDGEAYVVGQIEETRSGGSETVDGPWVCVNEGGEWKVDRIQ